MKTLLSLLLSVALAFASGACAQTLPATIKIILPFPPGGLSDTIGRLVAEGLRVQLKRTVVTENRAGANGAVAVNVLKQSAPDGGTLLIVSSGMITFSPHFEKSLPYDPARDLLPVVCVAYGDIALAVANNVPAANLREFIALARSSAQPLAMGSAGTGNSTHAYLELMKDSAKVDFLHVPFKGTAPALVEVMAGRLAGMFIGLSSALPAAKAGRVKLLAVAGKRRSALAPEIQTITEQGFPGVEILPWFGVMAPQGMSQETKSTIAAAVTRAFESEDMKARLLFAGATPWILSGPELLHMIQAESDTWRKLIKEKKLGEQ